MTFTGINPDFAVKSAIAEQKYPALQVTNYRPRTKDEVINFCLSENSFELISEENKVLQTKIIECIYNREKVLMHEIISATRWIFLNIPSIFIQDKTTKKVSLPERGEKLYGSNKVTIARCFLACSIDNNLVLDLNGLPQIFTLKLTSNKTQLIYQNDSEIKSIYSLNRAIQKHYQTKDDMIHLVSVDLQARPKEFVSNHSGDSSLGVNFELVGNAKVLQADRQKQIFNLVTNEETMALFEDPFGLKTKDEFDSAADYISPEDLDF